LQVKQAENKELRQELESMQKAMKDMKTKFEYVCHVIKLNYHTAVLFVQLPLASVNNEI